MNIRQFHNDENGNIIDWLLVLVGLFFLGLAYSFTIPLNNILINIFIENGAEVASMMFIRQMTIWAFALLGVFFMAIGFMSSYRKTYDQGITTYRGWR